MSNDVKPSEIYRVAWVAAQNALPAESRKLLEAYDALDQEWVDSGRLPGRNAALISAAEAVKADPLAVIVFELQIQAGIALVDEYSAAKRSEPGRQ